MGNKENENISSTPSQPSHSLSQDTWSLISTLYIYFLFFKRNYNNCACLPFGFDGGIQAL